MKKYLSLVVLAIISFTINTLAADDQIHSIRVNSINISTSSSQISGGFGSFTMNATDENGNSFDRNSTYGHFYANFTACDLSCSRGTVFSGFTSIGWLTGGTAQGLNETVKLDELRVSAPTWTFPSQHPRNRPLIKYIPITLNGKVSVVDNRPGSYRIFYNDNDVSLTGVMRVEFRQDRYFPMRYGWRNVQVTATRTPQ